MTRPCGECGKNRKPRDLAPLVRLADLTVLREICRRCFDGMVEGGPRHRASAGEPAWLHAQWSFWARQNGLDTYQDLPKESA